MSGDTNGAAGEGQGAAGAGEGGSGDAGAAAAAAAAGGGSVLAGGAGGDAGGDLPIHERFAEKFRTNGDDGAFSLEKTALRQAEAYAALEKRFGSGDVAPKTPGEYTIAKIGDFDDDAMKAISADPITQKFLERAHAKGATNAQVQDLLDFALTEWLPEVLEQEGTATQDSCVAELKKTWANEKDYSTNLQAAHRAFNAFAAEGDSMDAIGNNPVAIRLLANIAKEMQEDRGMTAEQILGGQTIDQLQQHPAYMDPKHPEHAVVRKRAKEYFERKHGTAAVM